MQLFEETLRKDRIGIIKLLTRGARLPQFGHSGSQVTPTRLMSIRDNNFVNLIFYYIFQQYIPANDD